MFTPQSSTTTDADLDVEALAVRRRLEALTAIGHTPGELAEELGLDRAHFNGYRFRVPQCLHGEVLDLFGRLQLTPGPSERARREARRRGFAPPLAWDDEPYYVEDYGYDGQLGYSELLRSQHWIDDPAAEPVGVAGPKRYGVPPDFAEVVLDHRALGRYDEEIARKLGLSLAAFAGRLFRAGLPERRHGNGQHIGTRPVYAGRYRLLLLPSADRLRDLGRGDSATSVAS